MGLEMEHLMSTARRSKKAVNVFISADLLQAARNGEINLSATLEAAVSMSCGSFVNASG